MADEKQRAVGLVQHEIRLVKMAVEKEAELVVLFFFQVVVHGAESHAGVNTAKTKRIIECVFDQCDLITPVEYLLEFWPVL